MDGFIGEVRIFCGTFTPAGWLTCDGQMLNSMQQQALYAVIGTTYGGNGETFALPNLNGRAPMHQGTGTGLTARTIGQAGGTEAVTLTLDQVPAHKHNALALPTQGALNVPTDAVWAMTPKTGRGGNMKDTAEFDPTLNTQMNSLALSPTGGSQAHNNMQPYLPMRFIICVEGVFPVRQ